MVSLTPVFRFKIWLILFGLLPYLCACENLNVNETRSPIVKVEFLPDSVVVGEKVTYRLTYVMYNNCGQYARSEVDINQQQYTITFYVRYPASICADIIRYQERNYPFIAESEGWHYFRFYHDYFLKDQAYLKDSLFVSATEKD
jgi:hypothetical protein